MLKHEKSLDIGSEPLLFGTVCAKRGPRSRRTRISCEIRFLVPGIECAVFAAGEVIVINNQPSFSPRYSSGLLQKTGIAEPVNRLAYGDQIKLAILKGKMLCVG